VRSFKFLRRLTSEQIKNSFREAERPAVSFCISLVGSENKLLCELFNVKLVCHFHFHLETLNNSSAHHLGQLVTGLVWKKEKVVV
jgi:hypothetical protein